MKRPDFSRWFSAAWILLAACGCQNLPGGASPEPSAAIEAHRASGPLKIDGNLDEPAWRKAPPVPFTLAVAPSMRNKVRELEGKGSVRLLYDDQHLYLGFEFEDADVVDFSKRDDQELFTMSDVAEIFLKPSDQTWYWEFHVTPTGKVSAYWWPGRGRLGLAGPTSHVTPRFIQAAAKVRGTINDWRDRDEGWTAEVAIPVAKLYRDGSSKTLGPNWTILVSRYNYSRYRMQATGPELSSAPALSEANYHLVEEYARLRLVE